MSPALDDLEVVITVDTSEFDAAMAAVSRKFAGMSYRMFLMRARHYSASLRLWSVTR